MKRILLALSLCLYLAGCTYYKVTDLASTRGPVFNKVVQLVDSGKAKPSQKTAPTKHWAAFVLSGARR